MDSKQQQGYFWAILGLLQPKKNSDCNQSVFFFEKRPFLITKRTEHIK